MNLDDLGLDALRAALLLAAALGLVAALGRGPAALKRLVLAAAFSGVLALPVASRLVPSWRIAAGPAAARLVPHPFAEPAAEGAADPAPAATVRASWGSADAKVGLDLGSLAFAGWALVAALLLARVAASRLRAAGLVRRSSHELDAGWRALLDEARAAGRTLDVRVSDELDAPAVAGVLAPVVLVPRAASGWSEARRRGALAHEAEHVAARDGLAQLAADVACALHWFDPFAWLAARALRLQRELAADDAALASGLGASSYAELLLAVAGLSPRRMPGALGMVGRHELERRIASIVAADRSRSAPRRALRAAAVTLVAASAALCACATPVGSESAAPTASFQGAKPVVIAGADAHLQAIVDEEIDQIVATAHPHAAVILVLDPATGRVLAETGRAGNARADVAFGAAFVPGSVFKAVTIAAALEAGAITPDARFDCTRRTFGDRAIGDWKDFGELSLAKIVEVSSNVGVSRVFDRLGAARFEAAAHRFHFGEGPGRFPAGLRDGSFEGAMAAIGEGDAVATPAQIAAAYAALASEGVYHAPSRGGAVASAGERVVSAATARALMDLLDGAVNAEDATGRAARVEGVRVAGKTGTAEYAKDGRELTYASFVGVAPRERPRFVVVVGAEVNRSDGVYGGKLAAPVFARVVSRGLAR